jgi:hypothetical protein
MILQLAVSRGGCTVEAVVYRIEEVFVSYDAAKHSLVVAKQHKSLYRVSLRLVLLLLAYRVRVEDIWMERLI